MKKVDIGKIFLTVFFLSFLVAFFLIDNNNTANHSGSFTVEVFYTEDAIYRKDIVYQPDDNLKGILEQNLHICFEHYVGIGNMVTCVRDLEQTGSKYIMIYVDGELSSVGIDDIVIKNGMTITFKLE